MGDRIAPNFFNETPLIEQITVPRIKIFELLLYVFAKTYLLVAMICADVHWITTYEDVNWEVRE